MMEVIKKRLRISDQSGVGLIESLIAVAIVGIAVTILLLGLSTGSLAVQKNEKRVTAENLARGQMEYVKSQAYDAVPASYDTVSPLPDDYGLSTNVTSISGRDFNLQKITITVTYDGEDILTLEGYKGNR